MIGSRTQIADGGAMGQRRAYDYQESICLGRSATDPLPIGTRMAHLRPGAAVSTPLEPHPRTIRLVGVLAELVAASWNGPSTCGAGPMSVSALPGSLRCSALVLPIVSSGGPTTGNRRPASPEPDGINDFVVFCNCAPRVPIAEPAEILDSMRFHSRHEDLVPCCRLCFTIPPADESLQVSCVWTK